ncbi:hypothetical protein COLO4_37068 [Corchorus olitorius]|uniref:Uncharacterized protein n=1 Tax=Corchorus olitorius TaxID=93759 RepID=A0A1R3G3H2_9ROSI|nr:hypothetical protein COLO4_37068 [Corchorus olitorius]
MSSDLQIPPSDDLELQVCSSSRYPPPLQRWNFETENPRCHFEGEPM